MIDIHARTKLQVLWDERYAEILSERFRGNSRAARRYMERKYGNRPGGGEGLNAQKDRHL